MSDKKTCEDCDGSGEIEYSDPNNPPSYNYGTNGPDYTDPITGYPMGYEPLKKICSTCGGKGYIE